MQDICYSPQFSNKLFKTLLGIICVFFISCGKPTKPAAATTIKLRGIQNLGTLSGGVMIYGKASDNANSFAMSLSDETQAAEINLKHDNYTFYAIGWDGLNKFEGQARCGSSNVAISGTQATVALSLTRAGCENDVFAAAGDRTGTGVTTEIKTLNIVSCKTLQSNFLPGLSDTSRCDVNNTSMPYFYHGSFRSYRLRLKTFNSGTSDLESICYSAGVAANTSRVLTSARLPSSTIVNYPADIVGYKTYDCTEASSVFNEGESFNSYTTHFAQGIKAQYTPIETLKAVGATQMTIFVAETLSGAGSTPFLNQVPYDLTMTSSGTHLLSTANFTSVPIRAYNGMQVSILVPNTANYYDLDCTPGSAPAFTTSNTCVCDANKCRYQFSMTSNAMFAASTNFTLDGRDNTGALQTTTSTLFMNFINGMQDTPVKALENISHLIGWPSIYNARGEHSKGEIQRIIEVLGSGDIGSIFTRKGFTTCGTVSGFSETISTNMGTRQLYVYGSTGDINPYTASAFDKKIQLVYNTGSESETLEIKFLCTGLPQGHLVVTKSGYNENNAPFSRKTEYLYNMATAMANIHMYEREVTNTTTIMRRYSFLQKTSPNELQIWSVNGSTDYPGGESFFTSYDRGANVMYSLQEYHANYTSSTVAWSGSTMVDKYYGSDFSSFIPVYGQASTYTPPFSIPVPLLNGGTFSLNWLGGLDNDSGCNPVTPGTGVKSDFDCDLE